VTGVQTCALPIFKRSIPTKTNQTSVVIPAIYAPACDAKGNDDDAVAQAGKYILFSP